MPFPFNKSLDVKLMELVKENPCLYNPQNSKYTDLDTREVVWQKIGDILNRPAQMCKSRWVNIRDMMRRKLRERVRNPNQSFYHYRYEEQLTFMIPFFKESSSFSTTVGDFTEFEENCEVENSSSFLEQTEFVEHDPMCDVKEIKYRKYESRDTSAKNERSNTTNDSQREFNSTISQQDPLEVFLLTIGSTLRRFSPYFLNLAKSKIFQVVQDYELEQLRNKESDGAVSNSDGR